MELIKTPKQVVFGFGPDGKHVQFAFRFENENEINIALPTSDAANLVLSLEETVARAQSAERAQSGGVDALPHSLTAHYPSQFAVALSEEGLALLAITFGSGMRVDVALDTEKMNALVQLLGSLHIMPGPTIAN